MGLDLVPRNEDGQSVDEADVSIVALHKMVSVATFSVSSAVYLILILSWCAQISSISPCTMSDTPAVSSLQPVGYGYQQVRFTAYP